MALNLAKSFILALSFVTIGANSAMAPMRSAGCRHPNGRSSREQWCSSARVSSFDPFLLVPGVYN
eukprot:3833850-Amphidinium_carterae.1